MKSVGGGAGRGHRKWGWVGIFRWVEDAGDLDNRGWINDVWAEGGLPCQCAAFGGSELVRPRRKRQDAYKVGRCSEKTTLPGSQIWTPCDRTIATTASGGFKYE